jgi:hypothetical protein
MEHAVRKDIAYRRIAEELYIVDAAASRLHQLNGAAALIWEGLAGGKRDPAIISEIVREFDVDEKTAKADMAELVNELSKLGLLAK